MKILIFNTLYYPNSVGGAEKSVQLLAEQLVKNGHEVSTVSASQNSMVSSTHNGVKCYYLKFKNIYWPFETNRNRFQKLFWHFLDSTIYNQDLKNLIDSLNPDLIHTNNLRMLSANVWDIAYEKSIPVVHTFRDYSLTCVNGKRYNDNGNCNHT